MSNPVEQSNRIVAAYNAKDFDALSSLLHADLDFSHVNRGFSYSRRDDLMGVLRMFANELMPDRRMGAPERVIAHGDVVVRVAPWGGIPKVDIPGFAKAGETVAITICSVMRFDAQGRLVEWKDYG